MLTFDEMKTINKNMHAFNMLLGRLDIEIDQDYVKSTDEMQVEVSPKMYESLESIWDILVNAIERMDDKC